MRCLLAVFDFISGRIHCIIYEWFLFYAGRGLDRRIKSDQHSQWHVYWFTTILQLASFCCYPTSRLYMSIHVWTSTTIAMVPFELAHFVPSYLQRSWSFFLTMNKWTQNLLKNWNNKKTVDDGEIPNTCLKTR